MGQEKVKLEETKKEQEANVNKAKTAFGNVAAATTGASQKLENGQPSAAPAAAPGAVLVAACPGSLIHGNDVNLPELQDMVYNHPDLKGITPEQVVAVTAVQMQYMQWISRAVPAAQADAGPPKEGAAEDLKQVSARQVGEEDPMTSDDEENELIEANKGADEVVEKARIRRSAKVAKKAKGKGVVASTSTTAVVKPTIGKPAT